MGSQDSGYVVGLRWGGEERRHCDGAEEEDQEASLRHFVEYLVGREIELIFCCCWGGGFGCVVLWWFII